MALADVSVLLFRRPSIVSVVRAKNESVMGTPVGRSGSVTCCAVESLLVIHEILLYNYRLYNYTATDLYITF